MEQEKKVDDETDSDSELEQDDFLYFPEKPSLTPLKEQTPPRVPKWKTFLIDTFFTPTDALQLAVFRILWGMMLCYEMYLFNRNNFEKLNHNVYRGKWNIPYEEFWWVVVPSQYHMELVMIVASAGAFSVMTGLFYRVGAVAFFLGFGFEYILESSVYLNHFYLLLLISFLLIFVPANARLSLDSVFFPKKNFRVYIHSWATKIFAWVAVVVYLFAAVVKLNEDWLRGEPMRHWALPPQAGKVEWLRWVLGQWYTPYLLSYGGIVVDFLQPVLLTHSGVPYVLGWILSVSFHAMNKVMLNIGLFPYMCIFINTLTLSPGWIRVFDINENIEDDEENERQIMKTRHVPSKKKKRDLGPYEYLVILGCVACVLFNILCPLRHLLYTEPRQVPWNEVTHQFSWRMKLRDKECDGFFTYSYDNKTEQVFNPFEKNHLSWRKYTRVMSNPWRVRFMAKKIADRMQRRDELGRYPSVRSNITCSLNFRYPMPMVYMNLDLASPSVQKMPVTAITPPLPPMSTQFHEQYPWNWDWIGIINGTVDMQKRHELWLQTTTL